MRSLNIDAKLSVNKFNVDEGNAHIELASQIELSEFKKLAQICPAGLYKIGENGELGFDYAGCLECGTCRILCEGSVIKKWEYPNSSFGVEYRFG
ncbi:ferredoxin family protein [Campylobacter sp. 19-13652]|uniref:ferredoxin family protein n=1 Tax=Campylobacter sp. 19-13652 TaxID=2840180 RepID=UPI001C7448D3|nr:ferredoxin family protein [Campylobacter sp. 19-13652]BCX80146.1 ferredoxin family protein [Campylobacter sp. 19-13652]